MKTNGIKLNKKSYGEILDLARQEVHKLEEEVGCNVSSFYVITNEPRTFGKYQDLEIAVIRLASKSLEFPRFVALGCDYGDYLSRDIITVINEGSNPNA